MARSIWTGAISFGLVNVPIKLYSAISEQTVRFHIMSSDGKCRLRQKLYCPETDKEYDFSETAKGYEVAPDQYVILEHDELDELKPDTGDVIEIREFVKLADIDPIYMNRSYYLGPGKGGAKPYRLLYDALKKTDVVGIGSFVMREREYLAAIRAGEKGLTLESMYYSEDLRAHEEIGEIENVKLDKRELTLATELIESWTSEFDPERYHNEYRERLQKAVDQKAKGKKVKLAHAEPKKEDNVVSLLDALKKSMKAKPDKGEKETKKRAAGGRK